MPSNKTEEKVKDEVAMSLGSLRNDDADGNDDATKQ